MNTREVNFWYWLVRLLPAKLVYFSAMWVTAHSTTGKYGNTIVPELSAMDAASHYHDDMGL